MKNTTQRLATVTAIVLLLSVVLILTLFTSSTIFCEGIGDLPNIMSFSDLHLTENLKLAKDTLINQSGVYCIAHVDSGTMYIGSSTNMGERLISHIFNYSSNIHLQRSIALYGLPSFIFIVVELCSPQDTLAREQYWLNWLFSLPEYLRYNFNPIADMPPSWLGKTRDAQSGSNHPNYGQLAFNAVGVSVFTLEGALVASFPSLSAAAKYLGITHSGVWRAIKRGSIVKSQYRIVSNK